MFPEPKGDSSNCMFVQSSLWLGNVYTVRHRLVSFPACRPKWKHVSQLKAHQTLFRAVLDYLAPITAGGYFLDWGIIMLPNLGTTNPCQKKFCSSVPELNSGGFFWTFKWPKAVKISVYTQLNCFLSYRLGWLITIHRFYGSVSQETKQNNKLDVWPFVFPE